MVSGQDFHGIFDLCGPVRIQIFSRLSLHHLVVLAAEATIHPGSNQVEEGGITTLVQGPVKSQIVNILTS